MGLDQRLDAGIAVDARGVGQVGAAGLLVTLAKAHQNLAGPRVVVVNRNLDQARLVRGCGAGRGLDRLDLGQQVIGLDAVWIEADLKRGVRRADLGDSGDTTFGDGPGHRKAVEERVQRHRLADLREHVFVAAEGVARHAVASATR